MYGRWYFSCSGLPGEITTCKCCIFGILWGMRPHHCVMGLPLFVVVCCLVFLWVMRMVNSHSYVPKYKTVISKTVLFKSSSPNSFRFHRQISFPGKLKELTIQSVELISQKLDLTKVCLAKHCTKVDQTFNLRT